jgi:hypothetical protein
VPPTPHACPSGHDPQSSIPKQPSSAGPHATPSEAQVVGTQGVAQWLSMQLSPGVVHVPQSIVPPQEHPSLAVPQSKPSAAQVSGVHSGTPQTFGVTIPHSWQGGQGPQSILFP